jgi:hypothetical protein
MKTTTFKSINYKEVLSMIADGKLKAIGSIIHQVNNQGEFTINTEETKVYKRRHTASKSIYDLIAQA